MALSLVRRTGSTAAEQLVRGRYLTDGHRLLRVVSRFEADRSNRYAELEDCLTLEVRSYSPEELYSMGLHRVQSFADG